MLSIFLDSHTPDYDLDDKKQLIWDMATAMNTELRQLAAAGAKVIQIEEPTIHFAAAFYPEQKELLDFLVDAFNHEVDGLDDVELWIHTCWGNPNMQKVYTGESYANSIEIYLERLKGDVWTVEATENELAEIDLFKPYADRLKKKVAVGVVSHRTLQADMAPVVAARIRRALEVIPADKLILSSDCGFGRQGFNRTVAFYKTTAIAQARNVVLKELGLEERYVPAADPSLQVDVLPDREPLTHLPSPWGSRTMHAFESLIGGWHGEGELPIEPPMKISADVMIERLGAFIVMRSTGEPAEMPDSISIIGGAPSGEPQPMHYFDSRGVKRLFMTTVDGATWRIWRAPGEDWNGPDGPGFNQRFIGEISADGRSIDGRWERGLGEAGIMGDRLPIGYVRG